MNIPLTRQQSQTSTLERPATADNGQQKAQTVFNRSIASHPSDISSATFPEKGYRLGGECTPEYGQLEADHSADESEANESEIRQQTLAGNCARAIGSYTVKAISNTLGTLAGGVVRTFTYPGITLLRANRAFENRARQMWQDYVQTKEQEGSVPLHTTAATLTNVTMAKISGALTHHIVENVVNGLTNPMSMASHLQLMGYPVIPKAYFDTKMPDIAGNVVFGVLPSEQQITYEGLVRGGFKYNLLSSYYKMLGKMTCWNRCRVIMCMTTQQQQ